MANARSPSRALVAAARMALGLSLVVLGVRALIERRRGGMTRA